MENVSILLSHLEQYQFIYQDLGVRIFDMDLDKCFYSLGAISTEELSKALMGIKFSKKFHLFKTFDSTLFNAPILGTKGKIAGVVSIKVKYSAKDKYLWMIIVELIASICSLLYFCEEDTEIRTNMDLTERESQVLNYILKGQTDNAISKEMNVSMPTVRKHIQSIFGKYNVSSKLELVCKIYSKELVSKRSELIC